VSEPLLRPIEGGKLAFFCPGCKCGHWIDPQRWTVTGPPEAPTINPSVLVTSGHYIAGHQGSCWCTYNAEHPDDPVPFACSRCHLFVRDGKIEFLGDCTHELAGKTVPMEPL
jgi:hypothetical protein